MNGKVAKRLRKLFPPEDVRKYSVLKTEKEILVDDKKVNVIKNTIVTTGNRNYYLASKDAYKLRDKV